LREEEDIIEIHRTGYGRGRKSEGYVKKKLGLSYNKDNAE
jgi:hypothetical protein